MPFFAQRDEELGAQVPKPAWLEVVRSLAIDIGVVSEHQTPVQSRSPADVRGSPRLRHRKHIWLPDFFRSA